MILTADLCRKLNRIFPPPVHPFNLNNSGIKTYSEWQFEKGLDTIKFYLNRTTTEEMFKEKTVLDIGCGAGGKTVYYASLGVKKIYGLEILEKYREEACMIAEEKGCGGRFEFICGDAAKLCFEDDHFDTIIMNDAMEHVNNPRLVLDECYRVLRPGGRLYLNFPPYYHPFGAHLTDVMGIPWVHCLFSEKTLINVYKDMVNGLPDEKQRIEFKISLNPQGEEYFSYINRISIRSFNKMLKQTMFNISYYYEEPLRSLVRLPARIPLLKEFVVRMVVCILEKCLSPCGLRMQ